MATRTPRRTAPAAPSPSPPLRTASTSSIGTLRTAQRRVSLARVGVWAALAAGPVGLAVACATPRTVVAAAQSKPAAPSELRTADPAGVAALFCDLWLRSDAGAADSSTAQAVLRLAPDVELPVRAGTKPARPPLRTVAVRSVPLDGKAWSVIVAAQFPAERESDRSSAADSSTPVVRYFAVQVIADDNSNGPGAFTVTAAPAQVAGPGTVAVANSPFAHRLPADGALASSLGEFFRAYLTGVGEVDRYLSPGTELAAVDGSGYTSVRVDEVSAVSEVASGAVPTDGTSVRVQARVTASEAAGSWPLVYELTMTARSGRWEVTAVQSGAPAKTSVKPTNPTAGGAA